MDPRDRKSSALAYAVVQTVLPLESNDSADPKVLEECEVGEEATLQVESHGTEP